MKVHAVFAILAAIMVASSNAIAQGTATKKWVSSEPLIRPKSDATHDVAGVKDPSVVFYGSEWRVFTTIATRQGKWSIAYIHFKDWAEAADAPWFYLDQVEGFEGYVAAPQVFWFTPQKVWYMVFQSGPPMYSTNPNIDDPSNWSMPKPFYEKTPASIAERGWLDFWVIGDGQNCHLFFSDDMGRLYRSQTSMERFPEGFDEPRIVMEEKEAGRLFEACNVYRLKEGDSYLLLVEAFDGSSGGRRYFRSWTSSSLEGPWTALNANGRKPFAGMSNVKFPKKAWTKDISHGEMLRESVDESLTIDPSRLSYLFQGFDPTVDTSDYISIPWRLGMLEPLPETPASTP
jgi:endo-1,4-beta-xylanase